MRPSILLVFSILLQFTTTSQQYDFIEYSQQEEIIILSEKTNIAVSGNKADLIRVNVNKDVTYQINKGKSIHSLEKLILPEPFDETFIIHTSDIRSNAGMLRGVKIEQFSASIEKSDGTVVKLEPEIQLKSERLYSSAIGEALYYEYRFEGLQEGDKFNIFYTYSFPYHDNWINLFSSRVFFHSRYAKISCDFSFSHPAALKVDTTLVHLEQPDFKKENNVKKYSWHFDNLPGCLQEPGSRPYKELPHFIFSLKPYDLIYEHWDSFKQQFIPLWLLMCRERERNIRPVVMDAAIGARDKDNLAYDQIAQHFIKRAENDSSGIKAIQYFQQWMVDSVKYDKAVSYYDNQETYMVARPGLNLKAGVLRDFAIESSYAAMILKLGLNFFTAYPCDKRSGEISEHYFAPLHNNDLMFATILNYNATAMLLPRSEYNQYYLDEFPFYYEDIPVMLIHTNDFGGYKANMLDSLRIINTPGSNINDNRRFVKGKVEVNLDESTASFFTSLILKGQYSTLCRPVYFDKALDPTVNPEYFQKVWDVSGEVILGNVVKEMTEEFFPFKTTINADYLSKGLIENEGKAYTIDLTNFLFHIGYNNFDSEYRFTDFYPDFQGTDHFIYQLVFNKNVILQPFSPEVSLENNYFTYSMSVKQQTPTEISIISYLAWKSKVIPKEKYKEIYYLLDKIKKNKALSIQVEL
jgi:hypothetical protein